MGIFIDKLLKSMGFFLAICIFIVIIFLIFFIGPYLIFIGAISIILISFVALYKLKYHSFLFISNGYVYSTYFIFPVNEKDVFVDIENSISINKKIKYCNINYIKCDNAKNSTHVIKYFNKNFNEIDYDEVPSIKRYLQSSTRITLCTKNATFICEETGINRDLIDFISEIIRIREMN